MLALAGLLTTALADDPFYDNSPFPAQDAMSVQSFQSQSQAGQAACTPTSYAVQRSYKKVAEPGPSCSYQSWVSYYETDPSKDAGIKQCKTQCNQEPACRSFNWFLESANPAVGQCELSYDFFDADYIQCDNTTNTNSYLAVFNVVNWTPPKPLVPNGNFETGCLEPWFFQDFTSDDSMQATVVACKNDCAPNGGKRYVKVTGNGQNGSTRDHIDAYIGQKPALTDDVVYRLSAHIRGDSGEFRFTYPVHTSVVIRADATREWKKVSATFTGRNVGTFLIQMDAPAKANFAIDNVKIEAV
jgi:hypothetical protein